MEEKSDFEKTEKKPSEIPPVESELNSNVLQPENTRRTSLSIEVPHSQIFPRREFVPDNLRTNIPIGDTDNLQIFPVKTMRRTVEKPHRIRTNTGKVYTPIVDDNGNVTYREK